MYCRRWKKWQSRATNLALRRDEDLTMTDQTIAEDATRRLTQESVSL